LQSLWNAAAAAGGLAFIGSLIDFLISRQAKATIKAKLEDWWLRFDDVQWGNFGRREAAAVVEIIDQWVGPRLWSWKRWRFSLLMNGVLCAFAICFGVIYYSMINVQTFSVEIPLQNLMLYPGFVVTFSISLSLTRSIASFVGRHCTGTFLDVGTYVLMLAAHWLLWCYWGAVSILIPMAPLILFFALSAGLDAFEWHLVWSDASELMPHLIGGWFPVLDYQLLGPVHRNRPLAVEFVYKIAMDVVTNGLRIGFFAVFLASYLFRPVIQRVISWLWLRVLESNLPVFTLVFGISGGLFKFGYSLFG